MTRFIMLVGLPGSGKTTYAKQHLEKNENIVHISSDAIREEIYGDESVQNDPNRVFRLMQERTLENLEKGISVIYDATNIKRKNRASILDKIPDNVRKQIYVVWAPLEECIARDANRARTVSRDVIMRMVKQWQSPYYDENVHDVFVLYQENDITIDIYRNQANIDMNLPHDNPHHSTDVITHCIEAEKYAKEHLFPEAVTLACRWHDCGKPLTKFWKRDELGQPVGPAHFYEHDNVGGYLAYGLIHEQEDPVLVAWLINNHMQPYFNSKYYKEMPEILKQYIDLIHEADLASH